MNPPQSLEGEPKRPVVLEVISRLNIGGPARMLAELVHRGEDGPFEIVLACGFVQAGEDEIDVTSFSNRLHRIRGLGRAVKPLDDLRAFFSLVRLIRSLRPEVVHTHGAKAGALGRVAAFMARVPVRVHTFHGHLLYGYFSTRKTKAVVVVERLLARASTRLVAVGSGVRDDLLRAGIGSRDQYSVILPVGPSVAVVDREVARRSLGLSSKDFVVVGVGRLTRIKRPDRLVEACGLLASHHPAAVLLVAGDGELRDEAESHAARVGLRCQFLGWVSDLSRVVAAADVLTIASDNEGTPLAAMEAIGAGLPVVATNVGSMSDVVSDGISGLLAEPSAEALAAALMRVASSPDLLNSLRDGARRDAVRFSSSVMANEHLDLYSSEIDRNRASTRRPSRLKP